jgi:peroxiredoxin
MSHLRVGDRAPAFRLPAAQGGESGPEDHRGRSNLILFFAKGMACSFCRQKMSQLARGLPRFRALDAEILQIAPTKPERGRFYAQNFPLPFPYLCDPDYTVYEAYGMTVRPHSLLWKAAALVSGMRVPDAENDFGPVKPALGEIGRLLNDDDLGFFVLDKEGVIRYERTGSYVLFDDGKEVGVRPIPSNDEIVVVLEQCEGRRTHAQPA